MARIKMAKCEYCGNIGVRGYTICFDCKKQKGGLMSKHFLKAHYGKGYVEEEEEENYNPFTDDPHGGSGIV